MGLVEVTLSLQVQTEFLPGVIKPQSDSYETGRQGDRELEKGDFESQATKGRMAISRESTERGG